MFGRAKLILGIVLLVLYAWTSVYWLDGVEVASCEEPLKKKTVLSTQWFCKWQLQYPNLDNPKP